IVSASNPAKRGDTISLFLTGLGAVTPKISDGAIGPSGPLSQANVFTSKHMFVEFDDLSGNTPPEGTITYAGLAPGLAGLYQLNVVIPTTTATGNVYIALATNSVFIEQVYIPISK